MLIETPHRNSIIIADDKATLTSIVAKRIADYVKREPEGVLGLFTGGTPVPVLHKLAQWSAEGRVNFSGITCFNLDERYPIEPDHERSFNLFMRRNFFNDVKVRAWHIPDGRARCEAEIADDCAKYEEKIRRAGGIGLQGVGIGYDTHVGYNEPGSAANSRTRLVSLHETTIARAAIEEYEPGEPVHKQGITMGMGTIMEAREIFQMASNAEKVANAMRDTLVNPPDPKYPSSLLKLHPRMTFFMTADVAAPWQRHTMGRRRVLSNVELLQNRT